MENKTESRVKKGGYSHKKADARQNRKRQEALIRQRKYDALRDADKVKLAMSRRGESKKEIARLTN